MDTIEKNRDVRTGTESTQAVTVTALPDIPLIQPGDNLIQLMIDGLERCDLVLQNGDILVLAQKIVSKSENRYATLDAVSPSRAAIELAREVEKDPRLVELILSESKCVIRKRTGVLIVEHNLGIVMANAGIDSSNIEPLPNRTNGDTHQRVLLLPKNPDASCAIFRQALAEKFDIDIAVIINDSVGRAWRNGTVGIAIGTAGIDALLDLNGHPDLYNRPLRTTQIGLADELAAAASIVMGAADEGRPIIHIRGYAGSLGQGKANDLIRAQQQDLFR